ncbi:MAG: DapH/DapD/GlmU-related protein [Bacteroidota bacterium]
MQQIFIHETAVVDNGCTIGEGTKIWHFSHIMSACTVGNYCTIGQNVFIASGVKVGNNVKIQNNVSLFEGIICEDEVFIGPSAVFTNVINPRSAVSRKHEYKPTILRKGVTIGANATIVCGKELGQYAFIGAGAVITKSVPPYALMVGNPGRQIGWMSEYGQRLYFNEAGYANCPESNQQYLLKNGEVDRVS